MRFGGYIDSTYEQDRLVTFNLPLRDIYRINLLIIKSPSYFLIVSSSFILSDYVFLNILKQGCI